MGALKLVAVGLTLLSFAPGARAETERFSDSGIDRPPYQQILDGLASLASTHGGWATTFDYGRSADNHVLRLVRIQDPAHANDAGPRPAVLISGSTHGNEYLNIEDKLAPWFLDHKDSSPGVARFLAAGGVLIVIPIANPDGFTNGTRENGHGTDLNRDFDVLPLNEHHFKENETRQLAQWLDKELTTDHLALKLTVDYHCCDGSLLYPWSYADIPLPAADQGGFEHIANLMKQDIDASYSTGNTAQVLGYTAHGTSKDYYYAKYHSLSFTFEGSYKDEQGKFAKHTLWWDHVLATLAP